MVTWFDDQLHVTGTWLGRAVILNRHQLTYYQAQALLDKQPLQGSDVIPSADVAPVSHSLKLMSGLASELRRRRLAAGALELASSELRFESTPDGAPVGAKGGVAMMGVVAELMILANSAVGEYLAGTWPRGALLRKHTAP